MTTADKADLVLDGLDRVAEAAGFLKLSISTIYDLMNRGILPSVKIGKARRIPRRALVQLAADNLLLASSIDSGALPRDPS